MLRVVRSQAIRERIVAKTVSFDGAAGNGATGTVALFTVTGLCRVELIGHCTEDLVSAASGTIAAGTASSTGGLIAQTLGTDLDNGELWRDTGPAAMEGVPTPQMVREDIILTVATGAITDGTITFYARFVPYAAGADIRPV